ncbi:MAG: sigma-70 family RNA polymerase sigma factor [Planctomycetia bacterium]|nr:sigma-70 family RNA polymerase sigma factor [Planctomycetia bacterium]
MEDGKTIEKTQVDEASEFFLKNYRYVRRIAFLNAPFRDLADDIVNDTFIEFTKTRELDAEKNSLALLGNITRNIALRYWHEYIKRRSSPKARLAEWVREQTLRAAQQEPNDTLEEEISTMMDCLSKLKEEHQQILFLHYFKGLPFAEVATIVHKQLAAVLKIASRLRSKLRQCVETTLGYARKEQP